MYVDGLVIHAHINYLYQNIFSKSKHKTKTQRNQTVLGFLSIHQMHRSLHGS